MDYVHPKFYKSSRKALRIFCQRPLQEMDKDDFFEKSVSYPKYCFWLSSCYNLIGSQKVGKRAKIKKLIGGKEFENLRK